MQIFDPTSPAFLNGWQKGDVQTFSICNEKGWRGPKGGGMWESFKGRLGFGHQKKKTWWWQLKYLFKFTPIPGEDEPILTSIFFKGVVSTTN